MTNNHIKPDYLFEISWEVCNKVGGIYTVLASKYQSMADELNDQYIFIGPDVWKETINNPDFIEDASLYKLWKKNAENQGLRIRIGRWNIPGKPVAVLIDFTPFFAEKDKIFANFWKHTNWILYLVVGIMLSLRCLDMLRARSLKVFMIFIFHTMIKLLLIFMNG